MTTYNCSKCLAGIMRSIPYMDEASEEAYGKIILCDDCRRIQAWVPVIADAVVQRLQAMWTSNANLPVEIGVATDERCPACGGQRWWDETSACPAGWHQDEGTPRDVAPSLP